MKTTLAIVTAVPLAILLAACGGPDYIQVNEPVSADAGARTKPEMQFPEPDAGAKNEDTGVVANDANNTPAEAPCQYVLYCRDKDGDGYGRLSLETFAACAGEYYPGYVTEYDDCDDNNPLVHPNALERCNGRDDDCDMVFDEDCGDKLPELACWEALPQEYCEIENPIDRYCASDESKGYFSLDSLSGRCQGWFATCENVMQVLAFVNKGVRQINQLTAEVVMGPKAGSGQGLAAALYVSGWADGYQVDVFLDFTTSLETGRLEWKNLTVPEWLESGTMLVIKVSRSIADDSVEPYKGPVQLQFKAEDINFDGEEGCDSGSFPQKTYINVFK